MTREEKAKVIERLTEKFDQNSHFYIADASGLTVAQVNDFRRLCFKYGIEYGVYKNTLIKKALEKREGIDFSAMFEVLKGFSGILFSREIANAPAKVMKEMRLKLQGRPVLKAAYVETDVYLGDESLDSLSELKSKNELIADIIALLQSPAKNIVSALLSGKGKVSGIVTALEKRAK